MSTNDPFASASNPQLKPLEFFGQAQLDAYYAILQKGVGKVPFDPAQHSLDQRVTALKLSLQPLPEHRAQFPHERDLLAESKEWAKVVWPSAQAVGLHDARQINNNWFKYCFVLTGETYVKKTGETVEKSTVKFLALYASEDECRAAYYKERGAHTDEPTNGNGAVNLSAQQPNAEENEKKTALAFLKVIVPNAARGKDKAAAVQAVVSQIAAYPVIAKHFTIHSPETAALLAEAFPEPELAL